MTGARSATPRLTLERRVLSEHRLVIAVDEVGRGALAGPVTVGAVVLDAAGARRRIPVGLRDSKLVPERQRHAVAERAAAWAPASALGWAGADEIDALGIIRALGIAASRAIAELAEQGVGVGEALVLLDGRHDYVSIVHPEPLSVRAVIGGDRDCASIAAASVIAKVARDDLMVAHHEDHPAYQWHRNKGYGSAEHRAAIRSRGLTPLHRATWALTGAGTGATGAPVAS